MERETFCPYLGGKEGRGEAGGQERRKTRRRKGGLEWLGGQRQMERGVRRGRLGERQRGGDWKGSEVGRGMMGWRNLRVRCRAKEGNGREKSLVGKKGEERSRKENCGEKEHGGGRKRDTRVRIRRREGAGEGR